MNNPKDLHIESLKSLLKGEGTALARLLNALSYIKEGLGEDSWVGFYVYDDGDDHLYLDAYQGHLACLVIANGKGVVGESLKKEKDIYVPDVSKYPGYICCDEKAKSEAVFYLERDDIKAVFDIDSAKIDGLKDHLDFLKEAGKTLINFPYWDD